MATKPVSYNYGTYNQQTYGRPANVEYKRFNEEYFSGADVRIYFGDVWVDEVVSLQFTLMENVAPIFGYASYTWDAVARGARQIQGSFRINFKESYYLHSITNQLEYKLKSGLTGTYDSGTSKGLAVTGGNRTTADGIKSKGYTIEHLLAQTNMGPTAFEDLALEFEKSLWGGSDDKNMEARANDRSTESWFYPESARPNLAKYGYNILIAYGPYKEGYSATGEKVSTTVHSLIGVQLTGVSQVIDNNGQTVYEDYSFIARDLDGNVNLYDIHAYHPEFHK